LVFVLSQTALFYTLAAIIRKQPASTYAAVAAGCAAIWQLMLHLTWPHEFFTIGFALLGLGLLLAARWLGLRDELMYSRSGDEKTITRGTGAATLRSGHAILTITLLVAFMKALSQLAAVGLADRDLGALAWLSLGLMIATAIVGSMISPSSSWRRVYTVAAVAMSGVSFLTLNIAIDLSLWRKAEIFMVAAGLLILSAAYVGRFREDDPETPKETVSFGLWLGSMLSTLPLLAVVFFHWKAAHEFSFYDEIALIGITLLVVATGVVWRVKASTFFGGGTLFLYLCVLVVSLVYQPQVAIGIYLTAGGGLLFVLGLLLAVFRDHMLAIPEKVAKRKGVFEVIGWR
jgi:hypothetical protein